MNANETILLCWHSANHGLPVLENALKALRNRKIMVQRVLYLTQAEKRSETRNLVNEVPVERISLSIGDPTKHDDVYEVIRNQVIPRVRDCRELHINISPGTPAMHAVWIVLHAGGAFPAGTNLWSSQFNPITKRTRMDEVCFPISTYLSEIRKLTAAETDVAVYEPESKSTVRKEAFDRLRRYAAVPGAPLLFLGERGTGKTRLVETFVAQIKQRKKIVTVPCGGLDSTLADSALFGHRKGAFTGAIADRDGFLKQADKGILFLDEVQDLPQTAQRKLVRTLQDRSRRFRPVGSDAEETANFELVCASNLQLDDLQKRLDADFLDRLSHLTVTVPPLRECREDISEDWRRVWLEMKTDARLGQEVPWNTDIENAVKHGLFPGNLRDLQRLALLIVAWSDGVVSPQSISSATADWLGSTKGSGNYSSSLGQGTRSERLHWFRHRLALWAKDHFGNWQKAAMALECDEKTLRIDSEKLAEQGKRG